MKSAGGVARLEPRGGVPPVRTGGVAGGRRGRCARRGGGGGGCDAEAEPPLVLMRRVVGSGAAVLPASVGALREGGRKEFVQYWRVEGCIGVMPKLRATFGVRHRRRGTHQAVHQVAHLFARVHLVHVVRHRLLRAQPTVAAAGAGAVLVCGRGEPPACCCIHANTYLQKCMYNSNSYHKR